MHSIWIADDDEAIRLVLEESLSSSGFKPKSFASGEDLVKELDNIQPDLIITDVQMPGMLGYDLLKHINNNLYMFTMRVANEGIYLIGRVSSEVRLIGLASSHPRVDRELLLSISMTVQKYACIITVIMQ